MRCACKSSRTNKLSKKRDQLAKTLPGDIFYLVLRKDVRHLRGIRDHGSVTREREKALYAREHGGVPEVVKKDHLETVRVV